MEEEEVEEEQEEELKAQLEKSCRGRGRFFFTSRRYMSSAPVSPSSLAHIILFILFNGQTKNK
ncbi:hypothetical protein F7725_003263 [Dissostichus mawsoni]|uniref:Uncharacterized protein n=1 Tax=Dissostichus mawsoni TaxID=36200 RepID=A0A7J5Y9U9_DISMA|nr:hypothetical protein F7725_003263 [Dissostichus mawsoni]